MILGEILTFRLLIYAEVLDLTPNVSSKHINSFILLKTYFSSELMTKLINYQWFFLLDVLRFLFCKFTSMQVILNLASLFVMCIWTYLYVRNVSSLFTIISISINGNYYYDFIFLYSRTYEEERSV